MDSRPTGGWSGWAQQRCAEIVALDRWRSVRDLDGGRPATVVAADGREVVAFASNDYLGLTHHPAVMAAAHAAIERWGTGAGAARLVVGSRPVHSELEAQLAGWKGEEAAVLFPTGYAANLGVLSTLGGEGTLILSDERNHASIVDGCRLARARVVVYRHGDAGHVAELLRSRLSSMPALVVSDSVFSMDGDLAPVGALAEVCSRSGALLVLDEAHAVLTPEPDLAAVDHLRVGTLSKTLGALGGFVAGPQPLVQLLVNRARPFIYTTAPSPADTAAALAALRIVRSPEGESLRERLAELVNRVAPGNPSPMVSFVLGSEEAAIAASGALLERGLLIPAIRPPTVPPGSSRLRVSLSAAHTDEQVDALIAALVATGIGQSSSTAAPA